MTKLTLLQLTPQSLKPAVAKALVELMKPIQDAYNASKEWQEATLRAYPPPEKKVKKVKDKGSKFPGKPKEDPSKEDPPKEDLPENLNRVL